MNSGYDGWKTNGSWHTCVCGCRYSDADGGPCHDTCECGSIKDIDENLCQDCLVTCECGSTKEPNKQYCQYCQEELDEDARLEEEYEKEQQ